MNEPCTSQELIAFYLSGAIADKRKFSRKRRMNLSAAILEHKAHEARDRDRDHLQHAAAGATGLSLSPLSVSPEPAPPLPETIKGETSPENSAQSCP